MPAKAALAALRRQQVEDQAAALRRDAGQRPPTPPVNVPRQCTGCEATEPENQRVPEPCQHYTCKPCKLINYLLNHGTDFAVRWYLSTREERRAMTLQSQPTCKHGCESSRIPNMLPERTPPPSPQVQLLCNMHRLSQKIANAAGDDRRDANYAMYMPIPRLQNAIRNGDMPAMGDGNTLYTFDHTFITEEGFGNVILLAVRGKDDEVEPRYLYIWANKKEKMQSLVACIQRARYGDLWPGDVALDFDFFRINGKKFGSIKNSHEIERHVKHEDMLVMKYSIL